MDCEGTFAKDHALKLFADGDTPLLLLRPFLWQGSLVQRQPPFFPSVHPKPAMTKCKHSHYTEHYPVSTLQDFTANSHFLHWLNCIFNSPALVCGENPHYPKFSQSNPLLSSLYKSSRASCDITSTSFHTPIWFSCLSLGCCSLVLALKLSTSKQSQEKVPFQGMCMYFRLSSGKLI